MKDVLLNSFFIEEFDRKEVFVRSYEKAVRPRYKARREEKKQEKLKVLKRTGIPVSEYRKIIKKNTI